MTLEAIFSKASSVVRKSATNVSTVDEQSVSAKLPLSPAANPWGSSDQVLVFSPVKVGASLNKQFLKAETWRV